MMLWITQPTHGIMGLFSEFWKQKLGKEEAFHGTEPTGRSANAGWLQHRDAIRLSAAEQNAATLEAIERSSFRPPTGSGWSEPPSSSAGSRASSMGNRPSMAYSRTSGGSGYSGSSGGSSGGVSLAEPNESDVAAEVAARRREEAQFKAVLQGEATKRRARLDEAAAV